MCVSWKWIFSDLSVGVRRTVHTSLISSTCTAKASPIKRLCPPFLLYVGNFKKYRVSLTKIYCVWHHTNSVSHSYCFLNSLLAIACFCLLFSSRLLPAPASTCSPDLLITCSRFPSFVFQDLPPASNLPLSAIHWISNDNPQERALWKETAFLCLAIIKSDAPNWCLNTSRGFLFLCEICWKGSFMLVTFGVSARC